MPALVAGIREGASCFACYRNAGLIGKDILGSGFDFQVSVRRGAGGYVCGEETTLLDTVQGNRREPRLRPQFPTESGLFRQPTVINNVETLAKPESTEGGRRVGVLKRQEGTPAHLG